jgi:hypothetical protein
MAGAPLTGNVKLMMPAVKLVFITSLNVTEILAVVLLTAIPEGVTLEIVGAVVSKIVASTSTNDRLN